MTFLRATFIERDEYHPIEKMTKCLNNIQGWCNEDVKNKNDKLCVTCSLDVKERFKNNLQYLMETFQEELLLLSDTKEFITHELNLISINIGRPKNDESKK